MSRRKDQQRFEAMKRLDSEYTGFRGFASEPGRSGTAALEAVVCRVCGRKRNVPRKIAQERGDRYVCGSCEEASVPEETAEQLGDR